MNYERPDPDALLARVRDEESRASRGKLRIFFGYAAGVGKTYAMLGAAQAELALGTDIVVGSFLVPEQIVRLDRDHPPLTGVGGLRSPRPKAGSGA